MEHFLNDYFRLPSNLPICFMHEELTGSRGFFRFGLEEICYGRCGSVPTAKTAASRLHDVLAQAHLEAGCVRLPFDPAEVIDNLRKELYIRSSASGRNGLRGSPLVRKLYYGIRNLLPDLARHQVQRLYLSDWRELRFPKWPVDFTVDTLHERLLRLSMQAAGAERVPFIWFWPDSAPSCVIMTHDIETALGVNFTSSLMDMDDAHGIKASFQAVPVGRYEISDEFIDNLNARGFELNVHDLKHDGSLFRDHTQFLLQAVKVNEYVRKFHAVGFRSGAMYRNQDWVGALDVSYDMSVPNVAHLEPQRGGCCTVMPYRIGKILELPLTMTQDYSLFHMLGDYSIDLWKTECEQILRRNGLISFIVHPDYVVEPRAQKIYLDLLNYLSRLIADKKLWTALPRDVNRWWRNRSQMELVRKGDRWQIEGPDKERARIAYAIREGDHLIYRLDEAS
jgi:hypothetical protein